MKIPATIFKYEGTNIQSLLNLKAQSFYMASPLAFNDPYDSALSFQVSDPSDEDVIKYKEHLLAKHEIPDGVKKELIDMSLIFLKTTLKNAVNQVMAQSVESFAMNKGVTCFSEINDELLMWAHYSDKYKGFCLEFRTDIEPFQKLRKVKYVPKFPLIDLDLLISGNFEQAVDLICTKSESWNYEKEWRLIHNAVGTLYTYPKESLKAIYFGPKIDPQFREILCLIMQGQNPEVEFWQGELSQREFKIKFNKVTYTPYIIAKSIGLRD